MVEKICKYSLGIGMGVSILVLALFSLIGYDTPWEEKPDNMNPQFTDLFLGWTFLMCFVTIIASIWSLCHGMMTKGTGTMKETGLIAHTNPIAWGTLVASIVIGLVFAFISKGEQFMINGKVFTDEHDSCNFGATADLMVADTLIISIAILMIVTVVATIASMVTVKK